MGLTGSEQPDDKTDAIRITDELTVPADELQVRFSRSSGPGGQHVNRSETRVELLFDIANSPSLSDSQRHTLLQRLGGHVDVSGVLRVVSSSTRSQVKNREDAVSRFQALLAAALKQRRRRVPTRPTQAAHERRLADKRLRSAAKSGRKHVRNADDE